MFRRMSSAIIKESFKNVPLVSLRLLVKVGLAVVTDQPGGSNGFIHTAFLSCLGQVQTVEQVVHCSTWPLRDPGCQGACPCPLQHVVSRVALDTDIRLADGEGRKWRIARPGHLPLATFSCKKAGRYDPAVGPGRCLVWPCTEQCATVISIF